MLIRVVVSYPAKNFNIWKQKENTDGSHIRSLYKFDGKTNNAVVKRDHSINYSRLKDQQYNIYVPPPYQQIQKQIVLSFSNRDKNTACSDILQYRAPYSSQPPADIGFQIADQSNHTSTSAIM